MGQANVLVVEDDDTIRRLLIEYLREHASLHVQGARDGVEALHRLSSEPFKVVVLDLMMPHMSGVDLLDSLEAIARDPSFRWPFERPAVLVITSTPAETLEDSAISRRFPALVRRVLRKPFDIAQLAGMVAKLAEG
jgi:CheY-like chemotaxis protein